MKSVLQIPIMIFVVLLASGCQSDNARIAEMAQRQAEREAEPTREMAQLQKETADGNRRLVEAEAQSRRELTALQRELRGDQAAIGQQRDALESERREIASARHWDSVIGPAIAGAAILIGCLLPIILCAIVLRSLRHPEQPSEVLTEILVEELVADGPRLLSRPSPHAGLGAPSTDPRDGSRADA